MQLPSQALIQGSAVRRCDQHTAHRSFFATNRLKFHHHGAREAAPAMLRPRLDPVVDRETVHHHDAADRRFVARWVERTHTRYRTLGHLKHIASGKRGIARHRSRARHHVTGALYHPLRQLGRAEEHTSELQSLMRISYAVFCLKKKNTLQLKKKKD